MINVRLVYRRKLCVTLCVTLCVCVRARARARVCVSGVYVCKYIYIFTNVPHINENARPTLAYKAPVTLHNTT